MIRKKNLLVLEFNSKIQTSKMAECEWGLMRVAGWGRWFLLPAPFGFLSAGSLMPLQ